MRDFCYLYLTCKDTKEASDIIKALLQERLVVCAKQMPARSAYWWQGEIAEDKEVLLVMEGALDLFERVEETVAKLHSYETFVLSAVPVAAVSAGAKKWMEENLHD